MFTMRGLNAAIHALPANCWIKVISSDDLLAEVRSRQRARIQDFVNRGKTPPPMKQEIAPVPQFYPSRTIDISAVALLHAIGRITTPPVPNLTDLSSTWAIIRYLWAFEPTPDAGNHPLLLSSIARDINFHQKAILSDEVGMGMAQYLMTNYFQAPIAVDISIAVQTPSWHMLQQFRASPDYLFYDDPTGPLYVVECKGTQTSKSLAWDQLRRGTEQVPSIVFSNGQTAMSLVIATCMLDKCTSVYVIDPPPPEDNEWPDHGEILRKAEKAGPNTWHVSDNEQFYMDSRMIGRAKMLAYAGADYDAIGQLPRDIQEHWMRFARGDVKRRRLVTRHGEFVGVDATFVTPYGFRVEMYRGLLSELVEMFLVPVGEEDKRVRRAKERISPPGSYLDRFVGSGYSTRVERDTVSVTAESLCRDGTILKLVVRQ